jgi:hypothetical protein
MPLFSHLRENPIKVIEHLYPGYEKADYIIYDKKVNTDFQYRIIRQYSHDGTFIFHKDLLYQVLNNLIMRTSYYKPTGYCPSIKYIVGDIHIITVYGKVDLACGRFPGEKERVWLPVKCENSLPIINDEGFKFEEEPKENITEGGSGCVSGENVNRLK